jgi:hypothetical protein
MRASGHTEGDCANSMKIEFSLVMLHKFSFTLKQEVLERSNLHISSFMAKVK